MQCCLRRVVVLAVVVDRNPAPLPVNVVSHEQRLAFCNHLTCLAGTDYGGARDNNL